MRFSLLSYWLIRRWGDPAFQNFPLRLTGESAAGQRLLLSRLKFCTDAYN